MPKSRNASQLGISSAGAIRLAQKQKSAGVPPHTYATLVYPIAFVSSSTTGSVWYWQFRLNSLFDPDFTGGGSQPTTFDQWMALYDRYRVIACEVDLSVGAQNGTGRVLTAFAPSQDAVPTLTFQGIAGMRDAVVAQEKVVSVTRVKRTYLMKDIFGVDEEAVMSELNYAGTSGTSAPSVAYGSLGVFTGTSSTEPILCTGVLRFAVRFESPHANNVSLTRAAPSGPSVAPPPELGSGISSQLRFDDKTEAEIRAYLARIRGGEQATPPRLWLH